MFPACYARDVRNPDAAALRRAQEAVEAARAQVESDPARPRYHLTAPAHWMNDPNGPVYANGAYHLFYQHNPYAPDWGEIHWGHVVSRDLVSWNHLPVALAPSTAAGEAHCFSGCVAISGAGEPTLLYTSIRSDRSPYEYAELWGAAGSADLRTWRKLDTNPLLTSASHGELQVRDWRDPFVWQEASRWYMVQGALLPDERGAVLLYESPDLRGWTYRGVLFADPDAPSGRSWECPNVFPLGDSWVVLVSDWTCVRYFIGAFDSARGTFEPHDTGLLDLGPHCYAPNTLVDPAGRRLLWGWIRQAHGEAWNGALTMPRVLTLDADGALRMHAADELTTLRRDHQRLTDIPVPSGTSVVLARNTDPSVELHMELEMEPGCTLTLLATAGEDTREVMRYDRTTGTLTVGHADGTVDSSENRIDFHIYLDRSLAEVCVQGRTWLTAPIDPLAVDHVAIRVATEGGPARLHSADLWRMTGIWT